MPAAVYVCEAERFALPPGPKFDEDVMPSPKLQTTEWESATPGSEKFPVNPTDSWATRSDGADTPAIRALGLTLIPVTAVDSLSDRPLSWSLAVNVTT